MLQAIRGESRMTGTGSTGAIDLVGTLRAVINDLQHKLGAGRGPRSRSSTFQGAWLVLSGETATPRAQAGGQSPATCPASTPRLRMALDVAHRMSKQDILDGYLNDAYFRTTGHGGIEGRRRDVLST